MAIDQRNRQGSSQPTLLDLLVVFVSVGAIVIFLFWVAYRVIGGSAIGSSAFEDLPPWLVGSFGFFTALATGSVGLGAAVIADMTRRGPRPDYLRLFIGCLLGALLLIAVIAIVVAVANSYVNRSQLKQQGASTEITRQELHDIPTTATQSDQHSEEQKVYIQVFKLPNVSRNGTMRDIQVTVKGALGAQLAADFILEYKWTGSGGTQNGYQGFTIVFKGQEGATLLSVPFTIDRSHCYYGGGNYERKSGTLAFDPRLIEGVQILLTEVSGTMGAC